MAGPYNIYPSVDAQYNFPPEIRTAFLNSTDVQSALNGKRDQAVVLAGKSNTGMVQVYAGATAPTGWLVCDGSAISRTVYADLFAAIGTLYGVGDTTTTFNLPNLKGRIPVGVDGSQGEFNTLAASGGEKVHQLSWSEMPGHNHGINDPGHNHSQNEHGHGINDPGHGHSVADPGHGHGIADPGHAHSASTLDGFVSYKTNVATRRQVALDGNSGAYAVASSPDNSGLGYAGINGSGTGIGVYGSGTGIGIYGNGTGVGVQNTTGSNNPSGTGVSIQDAGGNGSHNNLQPYVNMNYVIHI